MKEVGEVKLEILWNKKAGSNANKYMYTETKKKKKKSTPALLNPIYPHTCARSWRERRARHCLVLRAPISTGRAACWEGCKIGKNFPQKIHYFFRKTTGKVGKSRLKCFPFEFPLVFFFASGCLPFVTRSFLLRKTVVRFAKLVFSGQKTPFKKNQKTTPRKKNSGFSFGKFMNQKKPKSTLLAEEGCN